MPPRSAIGATQQTARSAIGAADVAATRIPHVPVVTPSAVGRPAGQSPEYVVFGAVLALHYTGNNQKAYGHFKVPSSFVGDATLHVHWTKNVDADQSGATVRRELKYTVYNGNSQDAAAAPEVMTWDAMYDDDGTTTRIVYRTPDQTPTGFQPGYYVGVEVGFVPGSTSLSGRPVLVSVDMLCRCTINEGA